MYPRQLGVSEMFGRAVSLCETIFIGYLEGGIWVCGQDYQRQRREAEKA